MSWPPAPHCTCTCCDISSDTGTARSTRNRPQARRVRLRAQARYSVGDSSFLRLPLQLLLEFRHLARQFLHALPLMLNLSPRGGMRGALLRKGSAQAAALALVLCQEAKTHDSSTYAGRANLECVVRALQGGQSLLRTLERWGSKVGGHICSHRVDRVVMRAPTVLSIAMHGKLSGSAQLAVRVRARLLIR